MDWLNIWFMALYCLQLIAYWLRLEASQSLSHTTYSFSRERRKYGVLRELPPPPPAPPLLPVPFCGLRRRMPLVRLRDRGILLLLPELWRWLWPVDVVEGVFRPREPATGARPRRLPDVPALSALLPPLLFRWGTLDARRTMVTCVDATEWAKAG